MELGTGIGITSNFCSPQLQTGDPLITKLLLHLDSDFSDSSIYNRTPTAHGAAAISSSEKVFGAGSLSSANTQAISFHNSPDWNIADGIPFQIDFRAYRLPGGKPALETLMAIGDWGAGFQLFVEETWTTLKLASNFDRRATWNYNFPLEVWTAHRLNYDGAGNYRWYVDGVLLGVRTPSGVVDGSKRLYVGGRASLADNFTGFIDEVKWDKHPDLEITTTPTYQVESAPFVDPKITDNPPVNPFSMTKLLVHCDSDFSDSSQENNIPTLTGSPVVDTGEKYFGAGSLSRAPGDRVTYPASSNWFISDGIPWQLSFRLFSKTGRNTARETFFANAGWEAGFMIRSESNWTELQIASNGFTGSNPKWPYVLHENEWRAHRINYDGAGNYRWYVDGILLGVRTATGFADTNAPLIIGRRPDSSDGFTGNMDEIKWEKGTNLIVTTTELYVVENFPFPNE